MERFLYQLCRIYSKNLPKGRDYGQLPPAIHVAITDNDLFPKGDPRNTEDFLSEYYLANTKNHQIFSGNFHMEVVSLKYLENAVDKDDPKSAEECERRLLNEWEYNSRMAEADRKEMERGMERGIEALIPDNLEDGHNAEIILNRLMRHFSLSREVAEKYYERHTCGVQISLLPK